MIYKITTLALLSSEAFGVQVSVQRHRPRRNRKVRVKPAPKKLVPQNFVINEKCKFHDSAKVHKTKPAVEQHKPVVKPKTKPVSIQIELILFMIILLYNFIKKIISLNIFRCQQ